MFGTLISSRPASERTLAQTTISVTLHAALILGAIHVTEGAAAVVTRHLTDTTALFIRPLDPPRVITEPSHTPPDATIQAPPGFLTITPPNSIPTGIPPVDLGENFDPSRFTGIGAENGAPPWGVSPGGSGDSVVSAQSFTQEMVDEPVQYLGGGDPVFPPTLRAAGIAGRVTMQFVVDPSGRVEPGSVEIVSSTSVGFEAAAREAILRARFTPAKIRGRAVRQLVRQGMVFEIG